MGDSGENKPQVKAMRVPGGQVVRLESDLPWGVLQKIAADNGMNWLFMVASPELGNGAHLLPLYRACCAHAGVDMPEKVTARTLLDAIIDVDDDYPSEFDEGDKGEPDFPKAEGPETN